jgi:hypothetical protein
MMWWDSLIDECHCQKRRQEHNVEALRLREVMFETLSRILDLDSEFCQRAALHGLGHLRHPDTEKIVQQYLERNPRPTDRQRSYAVEASKFEVL